MKRLLPAVAAFVLFAASPAALSGDEPGKKEGAKPAPAKEEPKPAPAPEAKKAVEPKKAPAPPLTARAPRSRAEALAMLDRIVVSVNFDETPLRDAVNWISTVTGVNVILGPALVKEGDAELLKVSLRLQKVSVRQALDLLVDSHRLGIGFQNGVLTVTTIKDARGRPTLRLYLVSDITFPLRDFPGPDMILRSQGEEREKEVETETKPAFSDPDDILRLLKDNTGEGTWEDEGISASVMKDWILVKQYEEVHDQIARTLALLRAAR